MTSDTSGEIEAIPEPVPAAFDLLAAGLLAMAQRAKEAKQAARELMRAEDE